MNAPVYCLTGFLLAGRKECSCLDSGLTLLFIRDIKCYKVMTVLADHPIKMTDSLDRKKFRFINGMVRENSFFATLDSCVISQCMVYDK